MHCEVTPFNPMIKVGKDCGLIEVSLQWFECLGQCTNGPRIGGKEMGGMKPKRIADTDKPFISLPVDRFILDPGILAKPTDSIAGKAKAPNDPRKNSRRFI